MIETAALLKKVRLRWTLVALAHYHTCVYHTSFYFVRLSHCHCFFCPLYFIPHAEKLETAQIWRSDYGVGIWATLLKAYFNNRDHQKIIAEYQAKYEDKIAKYNAKISAEDKAAAEHAAAG